MSAASFLPKASPMDIDNEDSLDAPPSVGSSDATPSTPAQKKVCRSSIRARPDLRIYYFVDHRSAEFYGNQKSPTRRTTYKTNCSRSTEVIS